jgi:hypothetical protein
LGTKIVVLMKRKILTIVSLVFIGSFALYFFYLRDNDEGKLMKQGNELVEKIEAYKSENGKLPDNLEDMGLEEKEEGPLYYQKWDSLNYLVYFGTSLGESMIYYSDKKEWDYRLRGMGDKKLSK